MINLNELACSLDDDFHNVIEGICEKEAMQVAGAVASHRRGIAGLRIAAMERRQPEVHDDTGIQQAPEDIAETVRQATGLRPLNHSEKQIIASFEEWVRQFDAPDEVRGLIAMYLAALEK